MLKGSSHSLSVWALLQLCLSTGAPSIMRFPYSNLGSNIGNCDGSVSFLAVVSWEHKGASPNEARPFVVSTEVKFVEVQLVKCERMASTATYTWSSENEAETRVRDIWSPWQGTHQFVGQTSSQKTILVYFNVSQTGSIDFNTLRV